MAQKPVRDWVYLAIIATQLFGMLGMFTVWPSSIFPMSISHLFNISDTSQLPFTQLTLPASSRPRRILPQIPLRLPFSPPPLPRLPSEHLPIHLWRPLLQRLLPRRLVPRLPVSRGPRPAPSRRLPSLPALVQETLVWVR
jgi:hypothetical protein